VTGSEATAPSSAEDPIQTPSVGYALQLVLACIGERHARACREILHGLGDQDLRRAGVGHHTGADRDRQAAALALDDLSLAGVQSGSHLDPERADGSHDPLRALDRAGRPVESDVEAVARRVLLDASEPPQLFTDDRMVMLE